MSFESYSALDGDHGSAAPRKRRKRVDECLIRTLHKLIVNPKTRSRHYVVNTSYELHKKLKKRNQGMTVARSTLNGLVYCSVKFVESVCLVRVTPSQCLPNACSTNMTNALQWDRTIVLKCLHRRIKQNPDRTLDFFKMLLSAFFYRRTADKTIFRG